MASQRFGICIILPAALALAMVPAVAVAQGGIPTREGNTWDWRHHEPEPSEVHLDEQAARIAPSSGQQQQSDDEVEQLYHQLMRNERQPEL